MKKTERLFQLLQCFRQYRYPVSGQVLANKMQVSLRTIYRDIAELQAQGADIEGEAGLGFQLNPGFMLPPLMFDQDELEAVILGIRWVSKNTDKHLQIAAHNALAKISAVLPSELRKKLYASALLVPPRNVSCASDDALFLLRKAIQKEHKVRMAYSDVTDKLTERVIRPLGIAFFEQVRVVIAWCELRKDFRHFRTDRIQNIESLNQNYSPNRQQLLKQWRQLNNIPEQ